MNQIHRTVWSPCRGAHIAVAETARSRGKRRTSGSLLGAVLLGALTGGSALAAGPPNVAPLTPAASLPTGAQVMAGQVQVGQRGNTLTVIQGSSKAAINWQRFSIGQDATVNFVQPNASAVVLNRVTGREASVIDGALNANGQVFVLNPNGVLFGKGARVDTAGLVASTLGLSDADFLAGKLNFFGDTTRSASVVNQGQLKTRDGGYVALLGQQVRNDGVISARLGTVALAAGNRLSLNFNGDSLVGVTLEDGALDALVANGGAVRADGGLVLLTVKAAEGLLNAVVNNSGEIRAQTVAERGGKIYLLADLQGGTVQVGGTLDAAAPNGGNGGFIETSAAQVQVNAGVAISTRAATGKTGTWLIDPTDFNIASGSAALSSSGIGASTLVSSLASTDVTIQTQASGSEAGNINVNSALAWSANKLTLEAHGDININAVMNLTGTSALDLKAGYNGSVYDSSKFVRTARNDDGSFSGRVDIDRSGTGILSINGEGYTLINSMGVGGSTTGTDLQGINGNLSGRFALATDLDANGWNGGSNFASLGNAVVNFTGSFNGLGHSISGLKMAAGGLFGYLGPAVDGDNQPVHNAISNLAVTTATASGGSFVGVLAGTSQMRTLGSVRNVYVSGSVNGTGYLGGLIGRMSGGSVLEARAAVSVTGNQLNGGGLIASLTGGTVQSSSASGAVAARSNTGGLIGTMSGSATSVSNSYATGQVTSIQNNNTGGLIGQLTDGTVSASYATGRVVGRSFAGGLVGAMLGTTPSLSNVYATGAVSGINYVGGLVGQAWSGSISNAYATGAVSGTGSYLAGFIGVMSSATITHSFWDTTSSGQPTVAYYDNAGAVVGSTTGAIDGLASSAMKSVSTYTGAGWNIAGSDGVYPTLNLGRAATIWSAGSMVSLNYTLSALSDTYNGGAFSLAALWAPSVIFASCTACQSWTAGTDFSFQFGGDAVTGFSNAGSYSGLSIALTSAQTAAYTIAGSGNTAGALTIAPRAVSLAATGSRVYDASSSAGASLLRVGNLVNGDTVNLSGSAALASKDVGSRAVGNISGLSLDNANYTLTGVTASGAVAITARPVTVTVTANDAAQKVYDGSTALASSLLSVGNLVGGDSGALSGSGVLASKDAGNRALVGVGSLAIDNSNYTLVGASLGGSATVSARLVTIAAGKVASRVYDGTAALDTTLLQINNVVSGDRVALRGAVTLASKNVGTWAVTGLSGLSVDSSNYTLGYAMAAPTVSVTALPLNISSVTGASRLYDAGSGAAASLLQASNVLSGETVTLSGSAVLASQDVGSRAIIGLGSLAIDNSNYTLVGGSLGGAVGISARPVSVTTVAGAQKVYDGSTALASNLLSVGNLIGSDSVALSGSAVLASQDVGSRAVSGLGSLSIDNSNYSLVGSSLSGAVGISARPVSVAPVAGAHKGYDGNASLGSSLLALGNLIGGDSVALSGNAVLASQDAGNRALVGVGSLALDNSNYTLVGGTLDGRATISPRAVDVIAVSGASRVYDGSSAAAATLLQLGNVVSGDMVNVGGSAVLASKDAGSRAVTGLGSLSIDNSNYMLVGSSLGGTVGISARPVSVATVAGAHKGYDGNASLGSSLLALGNLIGGDSVALSGNAVLASQDAGNRALVGVGSLALDNSNYTLLGGMLGGGVTISPRAVDVAVVSGATRVYDGSSAAAASLLQLGNLVRGDTVNLGGSAVLASQDVGIRSVTGLGSLALDNSNYTLAGGSLSGAVAISPRVVQLTNSHGATRVYDGSRAAAAHLLQIGNLVAGDTVRLSGEASLAGKDVGTRAVSGLAGLSIDNSNYTLAGATSSASVAITPRTLNLRFSVADRVFDGSTTAAASLADNRVVGDQLDLAFGAAYGDAHAGVAKPVLISGLSVQGADAGNYVLAANSGGGVTGTVTARPIVYTLAPVDAGATFTAKGQTLFTAQTLDQVVVASFANTVPGFSAGSISYTIWRDGQQVSQVAEAGSYTVRATLAPVDGNYLPTPNASIGLQVAAPLNLDALKPQPVTVTPGLDIVGTLSLTPLASMSLPPLPPLSLPLPPLLPLSLPSLASLASTFGDGVVMRLLSAPAGNETSQAVSLTQVQSMLQTPGTSIGGEVRIPVSRNSLAEIVNGGVRLPSGVDQLLFVVRGE